MEFVIQTLSVQLGDQNNTEEMSRILGSDDPVIQGTIKEEGEKNGNKGKKKTRNQQRVEEPTFYCQYKTGKVFLQVKKKVGVTGQYFEGHIKNMLRK